MSRRKSEWEIVKEINHYAKNLQFNDNRCYSLRPIMRIKKRAAQMLSSESYTLCYIFNAIEIDGGIKIFGRFVTGYSYEDGVKYASIGDTFHFDISRQNGLTIAKVLRKAFKPQSITIGS